MIVIDRRVLLRNILSGACAAAAGIAAVGFAVVPNAADALPLAADKANALKVSSLAQDAQVVIITPPRRRRYYRRRHRRWVCWWHRGRRVCGWR